MSSKIFLFISWTLSVSSGIGITVTEHPRKPQFNTDSCICFDNPDALKVPDFIDKNGHGLERLVIFLYSDTLTKDVKMYIPHINKQEKIPDLTFENGDILKDVPHDTINTILNEINIDNKVVEASTYPITSKISLWNDWKQRGKIDRGLKLIDVKSYDHKPNIVKPAFDKTYYLNPDNDANAIDVKFDRYIAPSKLHSNYIPYNWNKYYQTQTNNVKANGARIVNHKIYNDNPSTQAENFNHWFPGQGHVINDYDSVHWQGKVNPKYDVISVMHMPSDESVFYQDAAVGSELIGNNKLRNDMQYVMNILPQKNPFMQVVSIPNAYSNEVLDSHSLSVPLLHSPRLTSFNKLNVIYPLNRKDESNKLLLKNELATGISKNNKELDISNKQSSTNVEQICDESSKPTNVNSNLYDDEKSNCDKHDVTKMIDENVSTSNEMIDDESGTNEDQITSQKVGKNIDPHETPDAKQKLQYTHQGLFSNLLTKRDSIPILGELIQGASDLMKIPARFMGIAGKEYSPLDHVPSKYRKERAINPELLSPVVYIPMDNEMKFVPDAFKMERKMFNSKARLDSSIGGNELYGNLHSGADFASSGNNDDLTVYAPDEMEVEDQIDEIDDDDSGDFRIIGGNAATGSGTPLNNKGRSGFLF